MKKLNIMTYNIVIVQGMGERKKKEIKNWDTYVSCSTRSGSSSPRISYRIILLHFFFHFSDDPLHKNCLVSNIFSMENDINDEYDKSKWTHLPYYPVFASIQWENWAKIMFTYKCSTSWIGRHFMLLCIFTYIIIIIFLL